MKTAPYIVLAGPTAAGKSEIALRLAERLNGEIISVDSMQVYRGLDIGTAKPSAADRCRVPHHLIDAVGLREPFDAAQFSNLARQAVADIQSRHRVPILCGGTGLYFKAFLEGLGHAPAGSPELRAELESTPLSALLQELAARDPATYECIDRHNPRRVIRAVEVVRLTGRPFSEQRAGWRKAAALGAQDPLPGSPGEPAPARAVSSNAPPPGAPRGACLFGVTRPSSELHQRIDARVEEMFRRGLLDETRRLLDQGLMDNPRACQALGYRQVLEHLQGGYSIEKTIALVKLRTRQFAKRQMTWFRRQMDLSWVEARYSNSPGGIADEMAAAADRAFKLPQM